MKTTHALALTLLAAAGCSKSDPAGGAPAAASSSAPPAATSAAARPSASTSAAEAAPSAASAESGAAWKGTFKSKPGTVTLAKEAAEAVKVWAKDPGTEMVGDGTISLQIPATKGPIRGEIGGVFGDLIVNGQRDGEAITAQVNPKDPNAQNAMTGVFHGSLKGDALEGTLRVANRNANLVREAEIKLKK
jgi:hypothetical protein